MELIEHTECFVQKRVDEEWVWIIANRVGPWVDKKGNSGYWDCVNIYSQYNGIIKRGLPRKDFAGLIVAIKPKGLKEGKTKEQLKNSMDHGPLSLKLDCIETYSENSNNGKVVQELNDLFNAPIPHDAHEDNKCSLQSRIEDYLRKRVATGPLAKICNGQTYCGYTSTLSVEKYASEQFMDNRMPTSVFVVECIEGKVSAETISTMAGRYYTDRKIKLVIASVSGFDEHIKKLATTRDVQLIRVNPSYEITGNDILTPRMECGSSVHSYEHKMLSDNIPMTVPLVIMDGCYTTTSLTDFLKRNGIPVINLDSVHAPMLTRDFIRDVVSQIIKEDVKIHVEKLKRCGVNDKVPYCKIDPYKYARRDNLKIFRSDLSEQRHLGNINMRKKLIRLSDKLKEEDSRDRFSIAHEYGHYKLHSHPRFREFLERDAKLAAEASSDIWEKHWLEVQANTFASYMLMPREIVELLYNIYWRKWFKSDAVKPMRINGLSYWNKDFQNVIGPMSRHMGVSMEAMKIRLKEMELLIDPLEEERKAV